MHRLVFGQAYLPSITFPRCSISLTRVVPRRFIIKLVLRRPFKCIGFPGHYFGGAVALGCGRFLLWAIRVSITSAIIARVTFTGRERSHVLRPLAGTLYPLKNILQSAQEADNSSWGVFHPAQLSHRVTATLQLQQRGPHTSSRQRRPH